jgi:hypothetical protein
MELSLVNLGALLVFNCAVLAPFCRIADKKVVSCLPWGIVTIVLQVLMMKA